MKPSVLQACSAARYTGAVLSRAAGTGWGGKPVKPAAWAAVMASRQGVAIHHAGSMVPERRAQQRCAGLGGLLRLHGPGMAGCAPGLHGVGKGTGHGDGVLRQRHGGVEQHAVIAPFHHLAGVRRQAQAGIDQHRHVEALAQHLQGVGVDGAAARADGRGPGHDGLAAHIDQALAQHQVFGAVGQHVEAVAHQLLGGGHQVQRVGLQRVVVANHLELDPRACRTPRAPFARW